MANFLKQTGSLGGGVFHGVEVAVDHCCGIDKLADACREAGDLGHGFRTVWLSNNYSISSMRGISLMRGTGR